MLRTEMEEKISETMHDMRQKLLEDFDAEVHNRMKINMAQANEYLDRYARMLWALTKLELKGRAKFDDAYHPLHVQKTPNGVSALPGAHSLGKHGLDGRRFRLGDHPLARHILERADARALKGAALTFDYSGWPQKAALEFFLGGSGVILAHKLSVRGADDQDHIILAGLTDDEKRLDAKAAWRLFDLPIDHNASQPVSTTETAQA